MDISVNKLTSFIIITKFEEVTESKDSQKSDSEEEFRMRLGSEVRMNN